MATKRHKPEKIVTRLRQIEVLVGQGKSRVDGRADEKRLVADMIELAR
jgi:hypothetical protein